MRVGVALALCLLATSCDFYDKAVYGARPGVIEYPGSGAPADSAAIYVVQNGDTVDSVASRFGVPASRIVDRNSLKSSDKLSAGQWLEIPNARVVEQATAPAPSSSTPPASAPPPTSSDGRVSSTDLPPPTGTPQSQSPKPVAGTLPPSSTGPTPGSGSAPQPVPIPSASSTPPRPVAAARFDWPLRGTTLQGFGNRADGQRNDGINIAAAQGATVKAAEGGTVAYVGGEVKGLGNLVLLSHAGGYVTAYAHLDQTSVAKGATVRKGQSIGTVGQTGGVSQPQLHFEIRQRNKPVDPTTLLP
jgi:murein DD-endopeptidase MepM/ murein hydrolase activator NlpD